MTNLDPKPEYEKCTSEPHRARFTEGLSDGATQHNGHEYVVEVLEPRPVPLGGPRAMEVSRVLPQRKRSLIGGWCFVDAYGPDDVSASGGMYVPRHPHTGLATISWLFEGRINHIDSAGNWATVRPGEVNLMNAGTGITHSEISTKDTTTLHGVQFWYAFPNEYRFTRPSLEAHRPEPIHGDGWQARVMIGDLLGDTSPVKTYIPMVGAELRLEPGTEMSIDVNTDHEHGVLVIEGSVGFEGATVERHHLGYLGTGVETLRLKAGDEPVLAMLIGGEPLNEEIIMWWNFVGRSQEEIAQWRAAYQQEMGFEAPDSDSPLHGFVDEKIGSELSGQLLDDSKGGTYPDGRPFPQYGEFPPDEPRALPAPALPNTPMRARDNAPTTAERVATDQAPVPQPSVKRNVDRFDIYTAEGQHAGYSIALDYQDDAVIFPHTEVFKEFGGQGLAGILVAEALAETIRRGRKIVAVCPYVTKVVRENNELYGEHVQKVRPEHLAFIQAQNG